MKRSRFSEAQIIGILKEHQAGLGAKELPATSTGTRQSQQTQAYPTPSTATEA